MDQVKFFKGRLPQILLGPFWNTLSHFLAYESAWIINPFHANVPFLYPLKTSENQRFSDVFGGYRNGTLV